MKAVAQTTVAQQHGNHDDPEYDAFLARIQTRFLSKLEAGSGVIFTTDATGLFQAYLDGFPPELRQYHNCHACKSFIERVGGLVVVLADGSTLPAMWDHEDAPLAYDRSIKAMERIVRKAKITGPYLSKDTQWGIPETGVWHHFAVTPPKKSVYRGVILTAGQAMAEKREDFKTVLRALIEYPLPVVDQALKLLTSDALYRSEKVLGQAQWLRDLHVARSESKHKANVVWLAVAKAPSGFCHPRSSMIGTLLDDIAAGKDFGEVSRSFAAKMHPLQYQRPQAPPSSGAIAAAEKIVAQLGAQGSLARRFVRLDEVKALWRPKVEDVKVSDGVFGHLKPKETAAIGDLSVPARVMTFDKFRRSVLPTADRIEVYLGSGAPLGALVTAVNPDAPPILQWDTEENRNPVSWYLWHSFGGSPPSEFGLSSGWNDLDALALKPSMWTSEELFGHHGKGLFLAIKGARETQMAGAAIFPEILKSEFHGIRSVIEAYSLSASIEGLNDPHVAGILTAENMNVRLRVTTAGLRSEITLDRWD